MFVLCDAKELSVIKMKFCIPLDYLGRASLIVIFSWKDLNVKMILENKRKWSLLKVNWSGKSMIFSHEVPVL